ncbi:MAG: NADH-quinone oxidoreductase subunit C [Candidatus Goldbacteria bacterium]|nr:NADH-quinone oxidoreductase subunit C [Candidatus Goldiibacteriota bacterium]
MNYQEILEKIKTKVEPIYYKEDLGVLNAEVKPSDIKKVISFLKDELKFDWLNFITAIDWPENQNIEIIYYLYSNITKDKVVIRVKLDRNNPTIDTITDIFKTAEWHERETAEMFGVKFLNHPYPKRLLTIDGMDAPLRKDFKCDDLKPLPKD